MNVYPTLRVQLLRVRQNADPPVRALDFFGREVVELLGATPARSLRAWHNSPQ